MILVNAQREKIHYMKTNLREKGIDVSSWYVPLNRFYKEKEVKLDNCNYVFAQCIQLWLNYNKERTRDIACHVKTELTKNLL